jgi:hypothetical protein
MKNSKILASIPHNFGDLPYQKFMPSYKTYFILFMVKIWSKLNKYC